MELRGLNTMPDSCCIWRPASAVRLRISSGVTNLDHCRFTKKTGRTKASQSPTWSIAAAW